MARKPYISRTVNKMNVTCMTVDTVTAEVSNTTVVLAHVIKDPNALDKAVRQLVEKGTTKFVAVVESSIETGLYGIAEQDFMAHAVKLDPIKRSAVQG